MTATTDEPYRIAASACLTALESHVRRPAVAGLGGPPGAPEEPLTAPATDAGLRS